MTILAGQTQLQVVRGIGLFVQSNHSDHHVCLSVERGLRWSEFRIYPAEFMGHGDKLRPMKSSTKPLARYALGTVHKALELRQPLIYQHRGQEIFRICHVDLIEERVGIKTFDQTTTRQHT